VAVIRPDGAADGHSADGRTDGAHGESARARAAAAAGGAPLATIILSVAVVGVTFLAVELIYRLRDVVLLMVAGGFIALILNPMVVYLQSHRIRRRGAAVTVVSLSAALIFIGLVAAFGYPLTNGLTHLSHELPSYVSSAEHGKGRIGQLLRLLHLQAWVTRNAPKLPTIGSSLAKPALTLGKGAASVLAQLGTVTALVVLFLLEGPKMRAAALSLLPPERSKQCARVAAEINRSVTGYAFGNLLTSVIAGLVVFITLAALGVPFPLLWALWVGLVDFLPMIGGALAGIPTVLFALADSFTAGLVTLAVFVAYTQVENHVLNPVVMSRTTRVNPLLVLVSILVGTSIGEWLGGTLGAFVAALVSIPVAGALQVIVRELWPATAQGGESGDKTARREAEPGPA